IVFSRSGLLDIFLLLFGLLAIGFSFRFFNKEGRGILALFLSGLFTGFVLSVKWIGLGFWPLAAGVSLLAIVRSRREPRLVVRLLLWLLLAVAVPILIYLSAFLIDYHGDYWNGFSTWHSQAWEYHLHLEATHRYGSRWWSWPFLIRPIWFYYQSQDG